MRRVEARLVATVRVEQRGKLRSHGTSPTWVMKENDPAVTYPFGANGLISLLQAVRDGNIVVAIQDPAPVHTGSDKAVP